MPIDAISAASAAPIQRPPPSEYYADADEKRIVDYATQKFTVQKTQAELDLATPEAQRVASQTQRLQAERTTQVQQQLQTDQFYDSNPQVFQDQTLRAQLRQSNHAKFDTAIAGIDQQIATTPTSSAQNAQKSLDQANKALLDLKTKGVDAFDLDTASDLRLEATKAEATKLREETFKLYRNPGIPSSPAGQIARPPEVQGFIPAPFAGTPRIPPVPGDSFSRSPPPASLYTKLLGG